MRFGRIGDLNLNYLDIVGICLFYFLSDVNPVIY